MATVNEKMTSIAETIRSYAYTDQKYSLDGMVDGVVAVYENGYSDGYDSGERERDTYHNARYKAVLAFGDGTKSLSFAVPFTPDAVYLTAQGAGGRYIENSMLGTWFDFRTFSYYGGYRAEYASYKSGLGVYFGAYKASSGGNYFVADGSTVTFVIPSSFLTYFTEGVPYVLVAVKYTDKSDKELLEEEIAALKNEAITLQYSSARVLATVTEAEWATLIATKPNITFTLG